MNNKIMKLLSIFVLILFLSCSTKKSINTKITYIDYQEYSFEKFDSICDADNLNKNLIVWHRIDLKDYETNTYKSKYMYIKFLSDTCNLIYIIENNKIIKRKIYEN